MSLQGVRDSFYLALRDRLAALNPDRTVVVRGSVRPAVLVEENELAVAAVDDIVPVECFVLRWTGLALKNGLAVNDGLAALGCEIHYATDGSAAMGGLDRGRVLAQLDGELAQAVDAAPQNAAQVLVAEAAEGVTTESATGTQIFWSDVRFGPAQMRGERLERTASVEVYGYV